MDQRSPDRPPTLFIARPDHRKSRPVHASSTSSFGYPGNCPTAAVSLPFFQFPPTSIESRSIGCGPPTAYLARSLPAPSFEAKRSATSSAQPVTRSPSKVPTGSFQPRITARRISSCLQPIASFPASLNGPRRSSPLERILLSGGEP